MLLSLQVPRILHLRGDGTDMLEIGRHRPSLRARQCGAQHRAKRNWRHFVGRACRDWWQRLASSSRGATGRGRDDRQPWARLLPRGGPEIPGDLASRIRELSGDPASRIRQLHEDDSDGAPGRRQQRCCRTAPTASTRLASSMTGSTCDEKRGGRNSGAKAQSVMYPEVTRLHTAA
jgi:hypothetical protein